MGLISFEIYLINASQNTEALFIHEAVKVIKFLSIFVYLSIYHIPIDTIRECYQIFLVYKNSILYFL